MPYSSQNGKAEALELLKRFLPCQSILDIGAGSGTWADLLKPYVTIHSLTAIEVWTPYIEQFDLRSKYGNIINKDAHGGLQYLIDLGENHKGIEGIQRTPQFGIIIIGDMLEHLPRDLALSLIELCKKVLKPDGMILISVPIGEYPQDEYMGNPHEAHLDTWSVADIMTDLKPDYFIQRGEIGVAAICGPDAYTKLEPKVAVYMICKDEEAFIIRAISSVLGQDVAQVIVADTGSTDQTVKLLTNFGDPRLTVASIHVSPWRFDDARNASLSMVGQDIDLCISLDADELLGPDFIKEVKEAWVESMKTGQLFTRMNHKFTTFWSWQTDGSDNVSDHFHERVHARFGYRWVHPVHEKLVCGGVESIGWIEALMIQKPDSTKDRTSYHAMLPQAILEDPTDWKLRTFLADEQDRSGQGRLALDTYESALPQPGVDKTWVYLQLALLSERLDLQGRAKSYFAAAALLEFVPRELFMYMGQYHERRGERPLALWSYEQALAVKAESLGYMRSNAAWDGSLEEQLMKLKEELK
jgi:glycosyltransferase involved in cell wall biosynthesis/SAM-dependent methyltransferase